MKSITCVPEVSNLRDTTTTGLDNHPVSFISMPDAMNFCKWLTARYQLAGTFRLPTEAEWLFATYGTDRKFRWGDDKRIWTATSTQPVSRDRLRHEQFHRAAVEFAGHRAGRATHAPDHAHDEQHRVQQADGEKLGGPLEVDLATPARVVARLPGLEIAPHYSAPK